VKKCKGLQKELAIPIFNNMNGFFDYKTLGTSTSYSHKYPNISQISTKFTMSPFIQTHYPSYHVLKLFNNEEKFTSNQANV
jgi:hypothetical protein